MNQSFLQKLKRVSVLDLIHIFLFLIAYPLSLYLKKKHKDIWLFSDCPAEARDNAYWLFRYVSLQKIKPEIFFALKKNSPDYDEVHKYGEIIDHGSLKHWVYYLAAKNVISSQKASGPNAAVCYLLDRWQLINGRKIFLQHGIIKDKISFLYYKYTHIRLFTCSTQREYEYVSNTYGYPKGYVRLLGLCRFDNLFPKEQVGDIILIMPTWRKWLSHPTDGISSENLETLFLQSTFFERWMKLLNSPKLLEILNVYHKKVIFYLHREAQKYTNHFTVSDPKIVIAAFPEYHVQQLLKEASLLITDYSSVAMDFAYMDKPLIYYQFDQEEFRTRHLEEGYFDYVEDGFGPVLTEADEVLCQTEEICRNNWTDDTKYADRRRDFFTLRDHQNCRRTYEAIRDL